MTNDTSDSEATPARRSPADVAAAMAAHDRASAALGIEITAVDEGSATAEMTITDHHLNGLGVGHGGLTFTLADTAMAFASNAGDRMAFAVHADIDFLAPARPGQRLVATARARGASGRTTVFDVEVVADGEVLAQFRGRTRTVDGPMPTLSEDSGP